MAIVVRHDQNNSALDAAVALWLAQEQQRQAAREQAPAIPLTAENILQAVAPAGPQRQRGPTTPVAEPTSPSYRTTGETPAYRSRVYDDGGTNNTSLNRTLLGGQLQSALADQRYQNQDALAQERFMQQAQLQNDRLAHQLQEQMVRDAGIASRQFAADLPSWIVQGISSGRLRYSPAQLRERQELFDSIDKINSDDRFTPEQRATYIASARERIRAIDMAPQDVPPNEWPQTPQQQAQQISWEEQDPTTGLTVRKYLGNRNGTPQPELDPISKVHLDDWADERKYQRQLKLHELKLKEQRQNTNWTRNNTLVTRRNQLNDKLREAFDRVQQTKVLLNRVYNGEQIDDTGKRVDANDFAGKPPMSKEQAISAYNSAHTYYEAVQQELNGISEQMAGLESPPENTTTASPWQTFDSAVQGDAPSELPPPTDLSQAAPLGDQVFRGDPNAPENHPQPIPNADPSQPPQYRLLNNRVVVDSEDEARALDLQPGTPIITSQGRTGIWQP